MTDIGITEQQSEPRYAEFGDLFALLKPRVMSLVIFTAAVGLLVAPVTVHPVIAFAAILFIAVGAGASGALNMWWDADIDAVMKRTQSRPIPSGRVTGNDALLIGLWLSVLSVVMLALVANMLAAGLLAFTIFFYAVIYSMWLKRSTPQNIVIGGAAGAFPPMIGWVVATGNIGIEAILMFTVIFMWTPPHFWALALFMKEDYHNAGVPMMTVAKGRAHTRKLIFVYALILAASAIALGLTSVGGYIYMSVAGVMSAIFAYRGYIIMRRSEATAEAENYKYEKRYFVFSISYLFVVFTALLVERIAAAFGLSTSTLAIL